MMQEDADVPDPGLVSVLSRSREFGFLGPGSVEDQIRHSRATGRLVGAFSGEFLDLGAGGGLPGLVLLAQWPDAQAVLLDAQERRCRFLRDALAELGWDARAEVRCGRAETLARVPDLRGRFGLVIARGFGPPAVTAECAAGFLESGGRLVVTEPPVASVEAGDGTGDETGDGAVRWDPDGLAALGFLPATIRREDRAGVAEMALVGEVDARWPRRDGVPGKRPLW
jgi:16S rRNA (guanine527-N7)-methyltransferase